MTDHCCVFPDLVLAIEETKSGTAGRMVKIKKFYDSCTNTNVIKKRGYRPRKNNYSILLL